MDNEVFCTFEELPLEYKIKNFLKFKALISKAKALGNPLQVLRGARLEVPEGFTLTNESKWLGKFLIAPLTKYNDPHFMCEIKYAA